MSTLQDAFSERLRCFVATLGAMYPSVSGVIDAYRYDVVTRSEYRDDNTMAWFRLAENMPIVAISKSNKLYVEGKGLITRDEQWIVCTSWLVLQNNDVVVWKGMDYQVVETKEQLGIVCARIQSPETRFVKLPRALPTYRQIGIKVTIQ